MRYTQVALLWLTFALCGAAGAEVRYSVNDLGNLGQNFAVPTAVNDLGSVAGRSSIPDSQTKAFYWSAGTGMIDLIPPGNPGTVPEGRGYGVTDAGQVAGYIRPDRHATTLAFIWIFTTHLSPIVSIALKES